MLNSGSTAGSSRPRSAAALKPGGVSLSPEHYLRIILHRKWWVLGIFAVISAGTAVYSYRLPDIFTSDTLILVDPQKVPESYVRSTVTGDIRNRLGTLSQQILSATRLQKIIDTLNLYPQEKKTLAREDLIGTMRRHISVAVVSDFGGSQDLQAFRVGFSGTNPRLVAQVANELASLFIEENLKAREQQATGTTEFLQNQLQETRKTLEEQESRLRDFKLKHIGEMPEQQTADLQILGQLQSQLQLESDAITRAEQQKSLTDSLIAHTAPVVEMDGSEPPKPMLNADKDGKPTTPAGKPVNQAKAQLAALLARGYTDKHPAVRKLMAQIADEEAAAKGTASAPAVVETMPAAPAELADSNSAPSTLKSAPPVVPTNNPILQSQLRQLDAEIARRRVEQQRISKQIANYQAKLEAIPVREQQIVDLVRDYEISKGHYSQLLSSLQNAETATQLEIRQKGEKFTILDPAQPAERPSSPNRSMINAGGSAVGLGLGLLLALITEFMGMSITTSEQITESTGIPVLEVIPVIQTYRDQTIQRRRLVLASMSGALVAIVVSCAAFIHYYRN